MGRCLKVGLWNPILLIIEKQRNLKQLIGLWSPTLLIIQNQRNIQQMIELWSPTLLMIQKERNIQQMIELWSLTLLMIQKERNIQQMIELWSPILLMIQKERNIQQMIGLWSLTLLIIQKEGNIQQMIGLWSPTLLKQGNPKQVGLWNPILLIIEKQRNLKQLIDRALESNPSDHPESKKYPADDGALVFDPSDHPDTKKSQAVDRALESDPSDDPEGKKYPADDRAFESDSSDDPEGNIQQMIELWSPTLLMIQKERNIQQMIGLWSPTLLKQGNPKQICMDRFSLKFSSCSTIFLEDSTASCPHFETTLKSVALDFYFLIKDREGYLSYKIFDEHAYPLKYRTEEYIMYDPSETMIYKFIRTLFYVKSLKVAVAIIIMVYIQRLIRYSRIYICSATWRRIILGAILVAIKVRSNVPVCNKDLCRRFEKTTVDDLNKLEMNFLELINYDTNVSKSIYTVYYFRLRDLVYTYGLGSPICLLDTQRAWDLQALSRMEQDEVFYTACKTGSLSVDDLTSLQRAKAILS
uniref:cyclin-Y-like protein 2 n=1 Tax=Callithrix jacchus TaxID=9483 RepID=UPI0023DCFA7E|nr:cyclin-Y-like protein 2 [Callithrix jacchus]